MKAIQNRVYLRKLEKSDLPTTLSWMQRPDIRAAISISRAITEATQAKWFEALQSQRDKVVFAVCLSGSGRHIGNVSLDLIDAINRNARASIFLAEDSDRRVGLGGEALELLLTHAFDELGLHRVYVKMEAENPKLLQFYEKHGFVSEGRLIQHELKDGRFVDKQLAGLICPVWRERRSRCAV